MAYLVVSILFLSALPVLFRAGTERQADATAMNAVFRLTSGGVALAVFLVSQGVSDLPRLWQAAGRQGLLAAVLFWGAGFSAIQAVKRGHLGTTWTLNRCSMVIPTLASMIYWREVSWRSDPHTFVLRLSGVCVIVLAIGCLGVDRRLRDAGGGQGRPASTGWVPWMTAAFCCQGGWEVVLRWSRSVGDERARAFFITSVFVGAMLLSVVSVVLTRPRIRRVECLYGGLAGVCSAIGSGVRVWAVRDVRGVVLFPVTTISVLLLVQTAGAWLWEDRLGRWGWIGLCCAIAGVAMLAVRMRA